MNEARYPPEEEQFIESETAELLQLLSRAGDRVPETLRFHLITESHLDRIISAALRQGAKLVGKNGFKYAQKLRIVEALGLAHDQVIKSLYALNAVRNECAHQRDKIVTREDVIRIGSPLGSQFADILGASGESLQELTLLVFAGLFGRLSGTVYYVEHFRGHHRDDPKL